MSISLRRYTSRDAPTLGVVFRTAILAYKCHYTLEQRHAWAKDTAWNESGWQRRMDGIQPWVAERETGGNVQIAGYADVQADGLVDHFFIAPEHQNTGAASALMQKILAEARSKGLVTLHAEVSRNAQGFFARFGFMPARFVSLGADAAFADNTTMRLTLPFQSSSVTHRGPLPDFGLTKCEATDFEEVLALRMACMRQSLERIGRFDAQRARERFAAGFDPALGQHIQCRGQRIGFVTVKPLADAHRLEHLYIHPSAQSGRLGTAVLRRCIEAADKSALPMTVGVLDQSDALRFYLANGFVCVDQTEFDWELLRPVTGHEHD